MLGWLAQTVHQAYHTGAKGSYADCSMDVCSSVTMFLSGFDVNEGGPPYYLEVNNSDDAKVVMDALLARVSTAWLPDELRALHMLSLRAEEVYGKALRREGKVLGG